jgi:hypothetical protein
VLEAGTRRPRLCLPASRSSKLYRNDGALQELASERKDGQESGYRCNGKSKVRASFFPSAISTEARAQQLPRMEISGDRRARTRLSILILAGRQRGRSLMF